MLTPALRVNGTCPLSGANCVYTEPESTQTQRRLNSPVTIERDLGGWPTSRQLWVDVLLVVILELTYDTGA